MTTISERLRGEVIDPTLPRDSFVPPSDDEEDFDDVDLNDIIDIEPGDNDD